MTDLIGPPLPGAASGSAEIIFTSGKAPSDALAAALAQFGLTPLREAAMTLR
jgi:hypothetical protein